MKYAFATALIAAFASATEIAVEPMPPMPVEEEPSMIGKIVENTFVQNEDGSWGLALQQNFNDLPEISWSDVNPEEIQEWLDGAASETNALN